jgi:hypothetical protein
MLSVNGGAPVMQPPVVSSGLKVVNEQDDYTYWYADVASRGGGLADVYVRAFSIRRDDYCHREEGRSGICKSSHVTLVDITIASSLLIYF